MKNPRQNVKKWMLWKLEIWSLGTCVKILWKYSNYSVFVYSDISEFESNLNTRVNLRYLSSSIRTSLRQFAQISGSSIRIPEYPREQWSFFNSASCEWIFDQQQYYITEIYSIYARPFPFLLLNWNRCWGNESMNVGKNKRHI